MYILHTCIHWLMFKIYRHEKHRVRANWTLQAHTFSLPLTFTGHFAHTYGYEIFLWVSLAQTIEFYVLALCDRLRSLVFFDDVKAYIVSRWYTYTHTRTIYFTVLYSCRWWYSCPCKCVSYLDDGKRYTHVKNTTFRFLGVNGATNAILTFRVTPATQLHILKHSTF